MDKSVVDLGEGASEYSGPVYKEGEILMPSGEQGLNNPDVQSEFFVDPSVENEELQALDRFDPYSSLAKPMYDTSNPEDALFLFKALARDRRGPEIALEEGGEVYRGYLPGESTVGDIPILGPVVSALAPVERDVITPPETTYVEDMDRRYVDKVTPGEYGEPRLGTPAAIQGVLDFVGFLKDDPKGAASAIGEGIASIPETQMQGALALMQGADYAYDPETGETYTYDSLLLPATTAAGTMASIARTADDGSTVLGIMGGRMAKSGPSKFSEARAARRTKDDQQVFDETGAYFDDEVFPDEGDAFRFEIPTVNSELVGIEDVVRKSNDSSAGPGPRNYFYMDDKTDVTALKQDVVSANIFDDGTVSFESQFVNAAGELEPAKYPRLSEILDFPELYEQYPQLKDVYVARLNANAQAAMIEDGIGGRPTIALSPAFSPQMLQSYLLHEVQHVVQKIEGFPRGGDTMKMSDADYNRLAGEVEARNVEDRFLAARGFQKSGARSDTIPPIYDPSKVVPTQTRDTNPSQILIEADTAKAEGGVVSMVDVARNAGRGPRGVASLAPVARNMNRSMLG